MDGSFFSFTHFFVVVGASACVFLEDQTGTWASLRSAAGME